MMENRMPYKHLSQFVLRTPLMPVSEYIEFTGKRNVADEDLKILFENAIIKESIFLASPPFYNEVLKWVQGGFLSEKRKRKLRTTMMKYFSRMSSRCTPFGLFAGCSVGKICQETNIKLKEVTFFKRKTRLDMEYLVSLSKELANQKIIKNQILFYPNTSIYELGAELRYVEYKTVNKSRRHKIVAVEKNTFLKEILYHAKKGVLIKDLIDFLTTREIESNEAATYLDELISSQILISELEPSVSGPEFIDQIYNILKRLDGVESLLEKIQKIQTKLSLLDEKIGNEIECYYEIIDLIRQLGVNFEIDHLFHTDMVLSHKTNTLGHEQIATIKKAIMLMNKISTTSLESSLEVFKKSFYKRYGTQDVPLSLVLDNEIGIGYLQNVNGEISPLIDNIFFREKEEKSQMQYANQVHSVLRKIVLEAIKNSEDIIELKENDFVGFDEKWDDLPNTISFHLEVLSFNGTNKFKLNYGGGSSGARLLSRFCYADTEILTLVKKITDIECGVDSDKILAEIVHLPESRIGNVTMKPDFREFEIPYISKSIKTAEHQILVEDLVLSIQPENNMYLQLKSRKHNKEVLPLLTNAHSYFRNSLPVYHFLAELHKNKRSVLKFDLDPIEEDFEYIPRIEFKNVIISYATWNIDINRFEVLYNNINDVENLLENMNVIRALYKLPKYVRLIDYNDELLINLTNALSVQVLLDVVKNRKKIKLREFLYDNETTVKGNNNGYTNELIISFYNYDKLVRQKSCTN